MLGDVDRYRTPVDEIDDRRTLLALHVVTLAISV